MDLGVLNGFERLVSAVALHGLVDLLFPGRLLWYGLVFVPLRGRILEVLFLLASVVHFSQDVSAFVGVALVALALVLGYFGSPEASTALISTYLLFFHTPILVYHLAMRGEATSAVFLVLTVLFGLLESDAVLTLARLRSRDGERMELPPVAQRVVICHVLATSLPSPAVAWRQLMMYLE